MIQKANQLIGQVYKGVAGSFVVRVPDGTVLCQARGRLKQDGEIYIGDMVLYVDYGNQKGCIEKILPRKNHLLRPYVSNVDAILIVIAPIPKPDFLLVDKLLIYCIQEDIKPIICVNKADLAEGDFLANIQREYLDVADVICTSAVDGNNIDKLRKSVSNMFICFAGQSAVGKSSIINALQQDFNLAVGDISKKTKRGKHTTRAVEVFELADNLRIADTCGFSSLEIPPLEPNILSEFYLEFNDFADKCKYRGCNHIAEPDCAVQSAIAEGKISKQRYDRYKMLFEEAKENRRNRYE